VFDIDDFILECRDAVAETDARRATREALMRAMADAPAVAEAMRPKAGGLELLHHSPELTIVHVVWGPEVALWPHDHRMWAAIGVYTGQEDNTFYRRSSEVPAGIVESGGKRIDTGDVLVLGADAVHAVTNPLAGLTGAIHVYGGDFVNQPRSQWGPGELAERPYDLADVRALLDEVNARAGLG
jgi:predicted metal-dependent enzyme (double-stranded beta helix superfamily)